MPISCSICASTAGPFLQEPTEVTTSPFFIKCQACTQNFTYITFDNTVGRGADPQTVGKHFYNCPGCSSLYYLAIPYAGLVFDVTACPVCRHPFPTAQDITFPDYSRDYRVVLKGSPFKLPQEEFEGLYENLKAVSLKLPQAVDQVLLVETSRGKDIWVVCPGSDPAVQRALKLVLIRAVENKLSFSGSQRYEFAMDEENLIILQESEYSKP